MNVVSSNGRYTCSGTPRSSTASANSRSPPQAPPEIAVSPGPAAMRASWCRIASRTAGSSAGGKRGAARSGASIMWPLKSSARGGSAMLSRQCKRRGPRSALTSEPRRKQRYDAAARGIRGKVRGIRVLLLQPCLAPHLVVVRAIVEVQRWTLAAVLDDAGDGLPIRMIEVIAVGRQQIARTRDQVQQLVAEIVLAAVMRNLERIELQPLAAACLQQLLDRRREHGCIRIGPEEHGRIAVFGEQGDAAA